MRPKPLYDIIKSGTDDELQGAIIKKVEVFDREIEYLMLADNIAFNRKNSDSFIEMLILESKAPEKEWLYHNFWYEHTKLKKRIEGCDLDFNACRDNGVTPIFNCVTPVHPDFQGHYINGCEFILDHGGDVDFKHVITSVVNPDMKLDGITALMRAAIMNYDKIVRFLLEKGANKDLEDNKGNKAIDHARYCERNEIENILDEWVGNSGRKQIGSTESSADLKTMPEPVGVNQGFDAFIQGFLGGPNDQEVIAWLKGGTDNDFRSLGELTTNEESTTFAEQIYIAGAAEVVAVEIDKYPEGQNTGKLVIRLPDDTDARRAVFEWLGDIGSEQGFDPEKDNGQAHLFVMLD